MMLVEMKSASRANVPRAREGEEAEEQTVLDRTLVSSTAACPADPRNHCSICKSSRPALQPRLINDELNEAFQRGYVFDQQATNDWACCTVVDRICACVRWSGVRLAPCVMFPGRMTGA
ncbi:hypothetical protein MRX96_019614 [Rhipicephalus microplus]